MASNTPNLELYKKDPNTDGADTFNVRTMLNENWDKVDTFAGTVNTAIASFAKIAAGSYTGTGTSGSGGANELNLPFTPKLLIILHDVSGTSTVDWYQGLYVAGASYMRSAGGNFKMYDMPVTVSGNRISWYYAGGSYASSTQLNYSGHTYRYVALG